MYLYIHKHSRKILNLFQFSSIYPKTNSSAIFINHLGVVTIGKIYSCTQTYTWKKCLAMVLPSIGTNTSMCSSYLVYNVEYIESIAKFSMKSPSPTNSFRYL